jgi:hypothetical protein
VVGESAPSNSPAIMKATLSSVKQRVPLSEADSFPAVCNENLLHLLYVLQAAENFRVSHKTQTFIFCMIFWFMFSLLYFVSS